MNKRILISFILLAVSSSLIGQGDRLPLKVGLSLTANNYLGDYNDPGYFRIYAGGMLSLQKASRKALTPLFRLGFGRFADQFDGDEIPLGPDGQALPRFVETTYIHGEMAISYRLMTTKRFQPFATLGFGIMYFNPKDLTGRELIRNQEPFSEGASTNQLVPQLPLSIGFEYRLNRFLSLEASYFYRFIPTDYLDNYGQVDAPNSFDALQSISLAFMFSLGQGPELPPAKVKNSPTEGIQIIPEGGE